MSSTRSETCRWSRPCSAGAWPAVSVGSATTERRAVKRRLDTAAGFLGFFPPAPTAGGRSTGLRPPASRESLS
jgi:hypothetical protein